jgi:hypothetical protein
MNAAHFAQDFQRLLLWSLEALALPPVLLMSAVCIASVVWAFVRQQPFRMGLWRSSYWLVFTQLLFFPAIVAVGVLFPAVSGRPHPQENVMGHRLLDGIFYLSFATSALWLYRMKGLRWLSASLLVLQEVILLGAGFIAGMSVSGDWI